MGYYNGKKVLSVVRTEYIAPNGNIKLTQNGSYDVSAYKKAVVSVFPSGTTQKVDEENVGLTTSQLPATTLPKGLVNYVGGMSQKVNQWLSWSATTKVEAGITYQYRADGSVRVYGTSTGLSYNNIGDFTRFSGHKLLLCGCASGASSSTYFAREGYTEANDYGSGVIATIVSKATYQIIVRPNVTLDVVYRPRMCDLTERYGAGNEPTSTDDPRIKWLIHYLTDNPQYDEGSIVNAPVEKLSSKGFNIWDEEWRNGYYGTQGTFTSDSNYVACKNLIACSPNTTYFVNNNKIGRTCFYDKNGTFISTIISYPNNLLTTPYNCYYLAFDMLSSYGTTYNHDICINISGSMNGTYLPYQAPSDYPIPAEVQALDGYGLGIDDTLYNYIDFERKKFVKKVGVVDLGTLDWVKDGNHFRSYTKLSDVKSPDTNYDVANIICSKYTAGAFEYIYNEQNDKTIGIQGRPVGSEQYIGVYDTDYTDATTFKNAMNGVMLIYELATPIETDISEYLDRDFPNENLIDTYQGGEVEFENDNELEVPYSITYQYRVE